MRNLVCLIFLEYIASIQTSNPRSVNVALETVLEFDGKNDVSFIDNVQNFLRNLKTVITKNRVESDEQKPLDDNKDDKEQFMFTKFLKDTLAVLKSFNNEDLKSFFDALSREIFTWHAKTEIRDITDKLGFRRLIDKNVRRLNKYPAFSIRRRLNALTNRIDNRNRNGLVADFLNYLYKTDDESKFSNFLSNLKLFRIGSRRNKLTNLQRIIREGVLSLIDPLLKLDSKTITNIGKVYYKYIVNDSYTKYDADTNEKGEKIKRKPNRYDILNGKDIMDYIEDHVKVLEDRLSTNFGAEKTRSTKNKFTHKDKSTRRPRKKVVVTTGRLEKLMLRPRETEQTDLTMKHGPNRAPVVIDLNENSELKSVEEYLSTTKRQNRYKKITKRKNTSKRKKPHPRTTKKFRKAFTTTTLSSEGLSIEHFGSLFGRDFHRKSNDNDTFVQTVLPLSTTKSSATIAEETRETQNLKVSREIEEHVEESPNESKNVSDNSIKESHSESKNDPNNQSIKENITSTEIIEDKQDDLKESIKIEGDIVVETSTHTKVGTEITTPKPMTIKHRNFSVSILTKYYNLQTLKPTIYLRSQEKVMSNGTTQNVSEMSTIETSSLAQAEAKANESVTDNINKKPTEDRLENEIEGIMEKFNSTPIPNEFKDLVEKGESKSGEDMKVREQMKSDLARLLAPPTTKATVTALFTDPFDDIDEATDIL